MVVTAVANPVMEIVMAMEDEKVTKRDVETERRTRILGNRHSGKLKGTSEFLITGH